MEQFLLVFLCENPATIKLPGITGKIRGNDRFKLFHGSAQVMGLTSKDKLADNEFHQSTQQMGLFLSNVLRTAVYLVLQE